MFTSLFTLNMHFWRANSSHGSQEAADRQSRIILSFVRYAPQLAFHLRRTAPAEKRTHRHLVDRLAVTRRPRGRTRNGSSRSATALPSRRPATGPVVALADRRQRTVDSHPARTKTTTRRATRARPACWVASQRSTRRCSSAPPASLASPRVPA